MAQSTQNNKNGKEYFGEYGGQFVPPSLLPVLQEIATAYEHYRNEASFKQELSYYLTHYSGRPTPLYYAANLTEQLGGAAIYLKREDLNHLGAHKVNNTLGQLLLAKRLGKKHIIAETGAGQHGVSVAATAALLGMKCTVYMGEVDVKRQELNVFRMRMMGAEVKSVTSGHRGLKEAVDEALEALIADADNSFYAIGSAVGPYPYPLMVRDFQSVIGLEARQQIQQATGRLPDACIACVGGGSNAIGLFHPFVGDEKVALIGVEPGGKGSSLGQHAASVTHGKPGIVHGFHSYLLQDEQGEVAPVHSISAGLDYPGVGPEHAFLNDLGRAQYVTATDDHAMQAFFDLSRAEGIIPALESSHALAHAMRIAPAMPKEAILIVNLSGRGDKDIDQIIAMQREGKYNL